MTNTFYSLIKINNYTNFDEYVNYSQIHFNTYNFSYFLLWNHKQLIINTMIVIRLVKTKNTTPKISHDDNTGELSSHIWSFDGELGVGFFINVFISWLDDNVVLLIPISLNDDDVTLFNIYSERNKPISKV